MLSKGSLDWMGEFQRCCDVVRAQHDKIEIIAKKIFESIKSGGVFHVFGSGHSNMVVEELFHRAGGLVPINPIFEPFLMPHAGPKRVGPLERMEGVGKIIFNANDFRAEEVLLVASNSGINPASVELAQMATEKGLFTFALTSLTHSKSVPSRGSKKLYEVVNEIIDTGTPTGDACVSLTKGDLKVGPLSSAVSIVICELIVVRVSELFAEGGEVPPVYQSANVPGGEARNKELEDKYRPRVKYL